MFWLSPASAELIRNSYTSKITIGRRPSNEVVLDWDSEISRVHAALERLGDAWTVVDDGLSRNGSYLNGDIYPMDSRAVLYYAAFSSVKHPGA